ncbi:MULTISPECIES: hypothetical protein [Streptomyces]|uniref:Chitin-binding protein n=1 Tax=Streptomyces kaempferi TaxID=333725 RepID=A0ABW3XVA0_9ACTN|nr:MULTISPECIES: hypothetical protein [unclassified Streptomyces]QIY60437.1 hypothetical protein HEP85_00350 [Streptomyces sp. RPA4-2]
MRIRRSIGLAIATATLTGLSLAGAAAAAAAQVSTPQDSVTPDQCQQGGGTVSSRPYAGQYCSGGTFSNSPIE